MIEKPFGKVLVANRGEIACRVFKTAKRMGIKTVAVCSDADRNAVHTRMADEVFYLGGNTSKESYLVMDKMLEAVRKTHAEAVHPGYGFLSENWRFAEKLEKEGVMWCGPGKYAIEAMGDKIASKKIAKDAKVNVIPGFDGVVEANEVAKVCNGIGYPVMIKASAGGGGKGMRIAWNDEEAKNAYKLSKSEAAAYFGDDRILIEKYIEEPRHIEIQVMGDKHGNYCAFPERECSIQRRNQKVVEESPSALLDPETRKMMQTQACMLAKAVKYCSAGTVECLCDKHKHFYFLEMNTRLQVEHPVTEMVSHEDLVEHMFWVAAGHQLPDRLKNWPLPIYGHAVETRVYAEDPLRNFLPSLGILEQYKEPKGEGVRCDSGIEEGSVISMYYDPMICKLVCWGKDRAQAIDRIDNALNEYVIRGLNHNAAFVQSVVRHPRFKSGKITTNFIPEEFPNGWHGVTLNEIETQQLLAACLAIHKAYLAKSSINNQQIRSYHPEELHSFVFNINGQDHTVVDKCDGTIDLDGKTLNVADYKMDSDVPIMRGKFNGKEVAVQYMERLVEGYQLQFNGGNFTVGVRNALESKLSKFMIAKPEVDHSKFLASPMAGSLIDVCVKEGQVVEEGANLAIVEAMKMQNMLTASKKCKIAKIYFQKGATLALDDVIMDFSFDF